MLLGDFVESALARIGVGSQRVQHWLGKPCNCKERKEKLNALHVWARRVMQGATDKALDYLTRIMQ